VVVLLVTMLRALRALLIQVVVVVLLDHQVQVVLVKKLVVLVDQALLLFAIHLHLLNLLVELLQHLVVIKFIPLLHLVY
jgi:hypothetical protein